MSDNHLHPIHPELLAEKFAAAARMEDARLAEQLVKRPRLGELLRAIQWFSSQPGGLVKLAGDVLGAFPDRVLTEAMKKAGPPGRDGQWTLEQALAAWQREWQGMRYHRPSPDERSSWFIRYGEQYPSEAVPALGCRFDQWIAFHFDPELTAERVNSGIGCDKATILQGLQRFNYAYFKGESVNVAVDRLPGYLYDLCTRQNTGLENGPTWFPDVIPVLLDFLDWHADRERLAVADTEVSHVIADALDDAWETSGLGRITGKSGFGKTEKLKAECRAYPGRWRMVEAPLGDSLPDLIRAVGEAVGMSFPFGRLRPEDRQKVEFVLRNMRIGIVIDEAHRLCPGDFKRNSIAERYNWVRWAIVDNKLPCVLSVTFQTDKTETTEQRESRFLKTTGFNMDQFTRRITIEKRLPELLKRSDFVVVARHHLGQLKQKGIDMMVDVAMASPCGLGMFSKVKLRAVRIANRRGSQEVALQDFKDAILEVPGISKRIDLSLPDNSADAIPDKPASPSRPHRKTSAEMVRELCPGRLQTDLSVSRIPSGCSEGLLTAPVLEAV